MLNVAVSEREGPNKDTLNFVNTNARSLGPKTESLIDNLVELESQLAVVTETWFSEDSQDILHDLEDGHGYAAKEKLQRDRSRRGCSFLPHL